MVGSIGVLLVVTAGADVGFGQQKVPMTPIGIPVAPTGLANRPLPDKPVEFDTAEGQRIRVVAVTKALSIPWTIAFLPDGNMLVTERAARLRIIRNGVLDPKPIAGAPMARNSAISGEPGAVHGYMDVALHPQVRRRTSSSISRYTKPLDDKRQTTAIARGHVGRQRAHRARRTSSSREGSGTSRIAFGRDGMLYVDHAAGRGNERAGPEQPGRQGAAPQRRRQRAAGQSVRRQGRRTSRRSTRSAIAARSAWPCTRAPARCG